MKFLLPPIYPITDKSIAGRPSHLSILRELVRGGATLVQIRDKHTRLRELLLDLRRCVEFSAKHGIQLLVNDRCDLVLCTGADGVHLGQNDLPPRAAREILGEQKIIGFSSHSLREARMTEEFPIDYLAFGPVYPTATKDDANPVVGLATLRKVCAVTRRPVVAIGGIDLGRVPEVLEAGAQSVAVISGVMSARNLAFQMEQFLEKAMGMQ